MERIARILRAEHGAVTVDWIVLCAALVAFVVFASNLVGTSSVGLVNASSTAMMAGDGEGGDGEGAGGEGG